MALTLQSALLVKTEEEGATTAVFEIVHSLTLSYIVFIIK